MLLTLIRRTAFARLFRIAAIVLAGASLGACAMLGTTPSAPPPQAGVPPESLARDHFALHGGESVVGQMAIMEVKAGDTLPDIARNFSLSYDEITDANPKLDPWVPKPRRWVILPLEFILPDAPREGIVIDVATMRLFRYVNGAGGPEVITYPIGIGRAGAATPVGQARIIKKMADPWWYPTPHIRRDHARQGDPLPTAVPPGPDNPLGSYALYLSLPNYRIHGTDKPYGVGMRVSYGCVHLYPEDISALFRDTGVGTPVRIVNQPYLIGERNGVIYLDAHKPLNERDRVRAKKELYARLQRVEKFTGLKIDWKKVAAMLALENGIPGPIAGNVDGDPLARVVVVRHPPQFRYAPDVPRLRANAWYVRVADMTDGIEAERLAVMLNHLGPQIPARVIPVKDRYRVVAGPFGEVTEARTAMVSMKTDLDLRGTTIIRGEDKVFAPLPQGG
ncbi:MAG: L,D-transpeptidase family protein [Acidithiobacillus sp.]